MEVRHTPELAKLYQEIDQCRMARYERRMARIARQERQERVFRAVKTVFGYLFGAVLFMAYLFAGAIWASM